MKDRDKTDPDRLIQTRVPEAIAKWVKEAADAQGLSVASFLRRELILRYNNHLRDGGKGRP